MPAVSGCAAASDRVRIWLRLRVGLKVAWRKGASVLLDAPIQGNAGLPGEDGRRMDAR
jgi:hypothetical protein